MNESITIGLVDAAMTVAGVVVGCVAVGYGCGKRDGYLKRQIEELVEEAEEAAKREGGGA